MSLKGRLLPLRPEIPFAGLVQVVLKHGALEVIIWQGADQSIKQIAETSLIILLQHTAERPDEAVEKQALDVYFAADVRVLGQHGVEKAETGEEQTFFPDRQNEFAVFENIAANVVHRFAEASLQALEKLQTNRVLDQTNSIERRCKDKG